jgi:hypothetical protein
MTHLFKVLEKLKKENKKVFYYTDMGGEFYIYREKETFYKGTIYSFIEEIMNEYNVHNDLIIDIEKDNP